MSEEKKEKEKSAEPTEELKKQEALILRTAGTATGSNYLLCRRD